MGWLVRDGQVLATLDIAESRADRRRGLLRRDTIEGALLLRPCRAVHTIGMRFPLDVAFCGEPDDEGFLPVVAIRRMGRHRLGLPAPRATSVIEAAAGAFGRWGLAVGDKLEIR